MAKCASVATLHEKVSRYFQIKMNPGTRTAKDSCCRLEEIATGKKDQRSDSVEDNFYSSLVDPVQQVASGFTNAHVSYFECKGSELSSLASAGQRKTNPIFQLTIHRATITNMWC